MSLETAVPVRMARLICGRAAQIGGCGQILEYLPLGAFLRGELSDNNKALARAVASDLAKLIDGRLTFHPTAYTPAAICALIRTHKPDVLVIDHIGLLQIDAGRGTAVPFLAIPLNQASRDPNPKLPRRRFSEGRRSGQARRYPATVILIGW